MPIERPAQARDLHLDVLGRAVVRIVGPQLLGERVDRDGLVRMEQEHREQCALLAACQPDRLALVRDLQVPEDSEVHISRYLACGSRCKRLLAA